MIALLAVAALLFAGGGYTATKAALNIYSPLHYLDFDTVDQKVALVENEEPVSGSGNLLSSLEGKVVPGKAYEEGLAAQNNSEVSQLVRMVVRKYWLDGEEKMRESEEDLDLIKLELAKDCNWVENPKETTPERVVYYYKDAVASGDRTGPLTSTLTVDGSIVEAFSYSGPDADGVITYTYEFDGRQICIEAEVQSIQTHNAADAAKSAWGQDIAALGVHVS